QRTSYPRQPSSEREHFHVAGCTPGEYMRESQQRIRVGPHRTRHVDQQNDLTVVTYPLSVSEPDWLAACSDHASQRTRRIEGSLRRRTFPQRTLGGKFRPQDGEQLTQLGTLGSSEFGQIAPPQHLGVTGCCL